MRALDRESPGLLPSVAAEIRCRYVSPLQPFERYRVGMRVAAVGRTSVRFVYVIYAGDRLVADGDSTEVLVHAATGRPREIPPLVRARLAERVAPERVGGEQPWA